MANRRGGGVAAEGKCGVRNKMPVGVHPTWWSHLQIDWADAETGAVTAGLLGATPRPPVCGVYQVCPVTTQGGIRRYAAGYCTSWSKTEGTKRDGFPYAKC